MEIRGRFDRGEGNAASQEDRIKRYEVIVALAAEGKTRRQIGDQLGITPQRVHQILAGGPPGVGGPPKK